MIALSELHWAAGFMEGEGSFGFYRNAKGPRLMMSCAQVCQEPIERLKALFGGNSRLQEMAAPRQAIWKWQVYGVRAAAGMMTLYSLMAPRRKGQIEQALEGWRTVRVRRGPVWEELQCA
jgi:hypothetical protein